MREVGTQTQLVPYTSDYFFFREDTNKHFTPVGENSGGARGAVPLLVLFGCAPAGQLTFAVVVKQT